MQLNYAGKSQILVVAATNRPHLIDSALMRAGRMDKKIPVPPPDKEAREDLFRLYLSDRPTKDIDYEKLAAASENYTSSDIELLATEAARTALNDGKDYIDELTLEKTIVKTPPSISKEELDYYKQFAHMERW